MLIRTNLLIGFALISGMIATSIPSSAETITYTYDIMGRLTRAQFGSGAVQTYAHDNLGNRLQKRTYVAGEPANTPPRQASSPSPATSATNVCDPLVLGWTGNDPDAGDSVSYYVYMGSSQTSLQLVGSGNSPHYSPVNLQPLTTYYWQVVTKDSHNAQTAGPVWNFRTCNGLINPVKNTLTVSVIGDGAGSVTSVPTGIACTTSVACSEGFPAGSVVNLLATPDAYSLFEGWYPTACGNATNCPVNLDDDFSILAAFYAIPPVEVILTGSGDITTYQMISDAHPFGASCSLLTFNRTFTENLLFDETITINWRGGFDGSYTVAHGMTTLQGTLTIARGALTVGNVIIE